MRRAMHVLEGLGPQESYFYDHPFFGQVFLAAALGIIGYPDSMNLDSGNIHSIEMLYIVPRIIIGILAIIDTLIIYKISERYYNWRIALFASLLFAVMPITWLTRRILLDSILLPFLLSSIVFSIYLRYSKRKFVPILISGISLGLAIFTKIPIVSILPLVAVLIFKNSNKNLKMIGLWFVPVILIPLIWPAHAAYFGQFDLWLKDIIWQTQRHNSGGFGSIVTSFFSIDPVLLTLSSAGIVFAAIEKNYFLLLWIIPFVIFISVIGFSQYFYWIPILPAFCIAIAVFIIRVLEKIANLTFRRIVLFAVTSGVLIFGLINNIILITTDISSQFQAAAFTLKYLQENNDDNIKNNSDVTLISSPVYSWIFNYVFNKQHVFSDYRDLLYSPVQTEKILLIADPHFKSNIGSGGELRDKYKSTRVIKTFKGDVFKFDLHKYPYTSMVKNYEGSIIEVRIGP